MALVLDGATTYVTFTDDVALDGIAALTVDFDVFFNSLAVNDYVIDKFQSGTGGWAVRIGAAANTTFLFTVGAAANVLCAVTTSLVVNTWQHWTVMYDGGQATNTTRLRIWLDGVEQTVGYTNTIGATIPAGTTVLRYGTNSASTLDGRVANVKIWTASLTAAQIVQQRNMWRPVVTANLLYWHPLDDGVLAKDYSGNGKDGTVTVATQISGPPLSMGQPIRVL